MGKQSGFLAIFFLIVVLISLIVPVTSIEVTSGGQVVIDQPKKDLIVSAGKVMVVAPVEGDLIVAGGEVDILNNIGGDLIATGGKIDLKGDVGGKLIAAGGDVRVSGNVGRFVIATGGGVVIEENSEINGDVLLAGGKMENKGFIKGNLTVFGRTFENHGTIMGKQTFKETTILPPYLSEIFAAGFLVLGLIMLWFKSGLFERANSKIEVGGMELIKRILIGLGGIIVSAIIIVLLFISVVGIPSALLVLAAFTIALLLSNLFVSYTAGKSLISSKTRNPYLYFVAGFLVLFIAFRLPYIGDLIRLITTSLGFAGIIYLMRDWRKSKSQEV